jgi:hypothetical protein
MITVIVAGRNDDYGKDFRERLFRTALHNSALLEAAGIRFEYMLAEWNPLPDRPPLSEEFVARVPNARAVIVPPEVHRQYTLNPRMTFHEMAAKNAALRRAAGEHVIVTNADILFSEEIVQRIAAGGWCPNTLYRAHRIDVKPDLTWSEIRNPANQLPSGEGQFPPPYYLGAGGDFCLATRGLWHSLRGFNEQIRFSTRAKDWQFFLSAAEQGVAVKFIGDVYHLDHDGGFRNTGSTELNHDGVHFGRWWDIEFGLPARNADDWGFSNVRQQRNANDSRISVLDAGGYAVSMDQNRYDREVMMWLTRPADLPDTPAAHLLHAICAAHRQRRRIVCRIADPRLAVALSGFDVIASRFSVQICCNWVWPAIPGHFIRPFNPEPANLRNDDWILEQNERGLRVYEFRSGRRIHVHPTVVMVNEPEFNPLLARRLLRACLYLQTTDARRIAIYGMGSHTRSLLRWGLPDTLRLATIVETGSLSALQSSKVDAVVLSSTSFESDMAEECKRRDIPNVVALYGDWQAESR